MRNFALLCHRHHREAPDVADAEAFWRWVDQAELRDTDKWRGLDESIRPRPSSWQRAEAEKRLGNKSFFAEVRIELVDQYGWTDVDFSAANWPALMDEYFTVLEQATSKHFGVEKKASTHAWALSVAQLRMMRRNT